MPAPKCIVCGGTDILTLDARYGARACYWCIACRKQFLQTPETPKETPPMKPKALPSLTETLQTLTHTVNRLAERVLLLEEAKDAPPAALPPAPAATAAPANKRPGRRHFWRRLSQPARAALFFRLEQLFTMTPEARRELGTVSISKLVDMMNEDLPEPEKLVRSGEVSNAIYRHALEYFGVSVRFAEGTVNSTKVAASEMDDDDDDDDDDCKEVQS